MIEKGWQGREPDLYGGDLDVIVGDWNDFRGSEFQSTWDLARMHCKTVILVHDVKSRTQHPAARYILIARRDVYEQVPQCLSFRPSISNHSLRDAKDRFPAGPSPMCCFGWFKAWGNWMVRSSWSYRNGSGLWALAPATPAPCDNSAPLPVSLDITWQHGRLWIDYGVVMAATAGV